MAEAEVVPEAAVVPEAEVAAAVEALDGDPPDAVDEETEETEEEPEEPKRFEVPSTPFWSPLGAVLPLVEPAAVL